VCAVFEELHRINAAADVASARGITGRGHTATSQANGRQTPFSSQTEGLTVDSRRSHSERSNFVAVHQYQFGLLPRGPLLERYGTLPLRVVRDDFDAAWKQQPSCDVPSLIDFFLPRYHSWSSDIRMWGAENGNRIHVVYDETRIVEVSCRIAIPHPHRNFAVGVISVAVQCDWMLVLNRDVLAEPGVDRLLAAVRESNAAKFSINPTEFLEGLSRGRHLPE